MEMFSKELYELDRNTVQYMIDEMQETIDAQKETIDKMQKDQEKAVIKGSIGILRSLNMPEQDMIQKICEQYRISEAEIQDYL